MADAALSDWRSLATPAGGPVWGTARVPGTATGAKLFVRGLAGVQLAFFLSLAPQLVGLVGSRGVLPVHELWRAISQQEGWFAAFAAMPGWHALVGVSDAALSGVLTLGCLSSLALLTGFFEGAAALLSWSAVVTLCSLGTLFLRFQWDALLMECSFLSVLLVFSNPLRGGERPWGARRWTETPRALFWVFLLLGLRLWVGSGFVKLASGDPTWRNGTALAFHFETQPLPTPWAPAVHHALADAGTPVIQGLTYATLALELGGPWILAGAAFLARRGSRRAGRWVTGSLALLIGLQLAIAATGNYAFFNALTIGLTLWFAVGQRRGGGAVRGEARVRDWHGGARAWVVNSVALLLLALAGAQWLEQMTGGRVRLWSKGRAQLSELGGVHSYGLFARMTLEREELVIQASQDGREWRDYGWRFKPGEAERSLYWVAPHQPRLDWQAWFAALEVPQTDSWWRLLTLRLLAAEPSVLRLFARAPFGTEPPRYVRTLRYRYRFENGKTSGGRWVRELRGVYLPEMTILPP